MVYDDNFEWRGVPADDFGEILAITVSYTVLAPIWMLIIKFETQNFQI